ncbi:MAG: FxsA family protein [Bacillota bacterium]
MLKLLGIFIIIPLIELLIIIKIGAGIGFWPTLALIAVPGLLGAAMARSQGIAVLAEIKREIAMGRLPGNKIFDGVLIFCGGLLLITPGIITDIIGLSVLFPGVRKIYRGLILHRLWNVVAVKGLRLYIKR